MTHSGRIKIGGTSISQTISTLAAPKRSDIQEALLQLVDTHAKALVADHAMSATIGDNDTAR